MAYPEHQSYWFRAGSACGFAGLAMIALVGALASSNGRFDATGLLAIIGYVLLAAAVGCFVSGVRKWRFPLAGGGHAAALAAPQFKLNYYARTPFTRIPYVERADWMTGHFIGITSPEGQPERQVRVYLHGIDPHPRHIPDPQDEPQFSYTVPPDRGNPDADQAIQPGQEESWFLGVTATDTIGGIMSAGSFANHRWRGTPWILDPDETWRLSYRVTCDRMLAMRFTIVVDSLDGKTIRVRRQG
jgi:hypothetical protein